LNNKIGIVISTYQRKDGSTPFYLQKTLESVKNQTYQNYHVYLIGDKYDNDDEFVVLSKKIDPKKITAINLDRAVEREKYASEPRLLWFSGGANATNTGVNLALKDGISYITMLDHDDCWTENHLELVSQQINQHSPIFICTVSSHIENQKLPVINSAKLVVNILPTAGRMIKSACIIDFSRTDLRIRDVYADTGKAQAGDFDLWRRLRKEMEEKQLIGKAINIMTCFHDHEGHTKDSLEFKKEGASLKKLHTILEKMEGKTFHHHYHVLYDLRDNIKKTTATYVEIGAYCGASASLMSSHSKLTNIISIDLGSPISPEIPKRNVAKFKQDNNQYTYIQGSSYSKEVIAKIKEIAPVIDILFIDGDHSYQGVKADFEAYRELVAEGGYVIFDDYLDWEHSAHVKHAVDEYVQQELLPEFEIIGSLPNSSNAHPKSLKFSNVFILKKNTLTIRNN